MIYDYITGNPIDYNNIKFENPFKSFHCERCGKKTGDVQPTIEPGYLFLCNKCSNEMSDYEDSMLNQEEEKGLKSYILRLFK